MTDLKKEALKIAVSKPSLIVMGTGIGLMGYIVYYVFGSDAMTEFQQWVVKFFSISSIVIFFVGVAMVFYRAKKDDEKEEKRAHHAPRVRITDRQRAACGQFPDPTPWHLAIKQPCAADLALLDDPRALLDRLTANRLNLGVTQALATIVREGNQITVQSAPMNPDETRMVSVDDK